MTPTSASTRRRAQHARKSVASATATTGAQPAPDLGSFRAGTRNGNRPESFATWHIETADPRIAEAAASLFGSSVTQAERHGTAIFGIPTEGSAVTIVVSSAADLVVGMRRWGNGVLLHDCDGRQLVGPNRDASRPCGCPSAFAERRDLARQGRGPQPHLSVMFTIAGSPGLGQFKFRSKSWSLAEQFADVRRDLVGRRDVLYSLGLALVRSPETVKTPFEYSVPTIRTIGP